nr:WbqC family protein [Methylobacterium sp. ZNC0032]
MTGLVAIHQPNFFPWLGYFDKIRRADALVFLDAVDFPKTGAGNWTNRVKLNIQAEARWVTCPINRPGLGVPIHSVAIDESQPWRTKLLRTLEANYRRAARFAPTMALIEPLVRSEQNSIAAFNIAAIQAIAESLGLTTRLVLQSDLTADGKATDLLISLVKAVGGDGYLAGGGAAGYQQDEAFGEAGLRLVYQNFVPRPYGDPARFLPGLSIIDYLMHDGRPLEEAFPTQ